LAPTTRRNTLPEWMRVQIAIPAPHACHTSRSTSQAVWRNRAKLAVLARERRLGGSNGFVVDESMDLVGRLLRRRHLARPQVLAHSLWDREPAQGLGEPRVGRDHNC